MGCSGPFFQELGRAMCGFPKLPHKANRHWAEQSTRKRIHSGRNIRQQTLGMCVYSFAREKINLTVSIHKENSCIEYQKLPLETGKSGTSVFLGSVLSHCMRL